MLVGLVGCGKWGSFILRDLRSLGAEVVVVARSEESRQRARQGGASRIVATPDELGTVAAVVVATPPTTHFPIIKQLLSREQPPFIFTEKPLCVSAEHAHELVRLGHDRVFAMHQWRYHPGVLALADLIRTQALGALTGLQLQMLDWGTARADANTIWHLMTHQLSIVLELLGHIPEPVAARIDTTGTRIRGMAALLGNRPFVQIDVSDRHETVTRQVRVLAEHGTAVLAGAYEPELLLYRTDTIQRKTQPQPERIPIATDMPLRLELAYFLQFIRENRPIPKTTVTDAALIVVRTEQLLNLAVSI